MEWLRLEKTLRIISSNPLLWGVLTITGELNMKVGCRSQFVERKIGFFGFWFGLEGCPSCCYWFACWFACCCVCVLTYPCWTKQLLEAIAPTNCASACSYSGKRTPGTENSNKSTGLVVVNSGKLEVWIHRVALDCYKSVTVTKTQIF